MTHNTDKAALWQAAQLEAANFTVDPQILEGRDLLTGYAIDESYSADSDDIVDATSRGDDGDIAHVGIAEVGSFIIPGRDMFDYAAEQVVTHYRKGRVVTPMLPPEVSENKLSLRTKQPRPVAAIHIPVDPDGRRGEAVITRNIARAKFLTPKMVGEAIRGKGKDVTHLRRLKRVAQRLFIARHAGTNVPFSLEDEEGRALQTTEGFIGRFIVQEFMLAANMGWAEYARSNGIPVPYRNLVLPTSEASDTNPELLGAVARASYSTTPLGHGALHVPQYLHGTAPLRRLTDLLFQGNLIAHEEDRDYPYQGDFLEELVERANTASPQSRRNATRAAEKAAHAKKRSADLLCERMNAGVATGETVALMLADQLEGDPEEIQAARRMAAEYVASNIQVAKTVLRLALDKGWLRSVDPPDASEKSDWIRHMLRVQDDKIFPLKQLQDRLRNDYEIATFFGRIADHEVEPFIPVDRQTPKDKDPVRFLEIWCAKTGQRVMYSSTGTGNPPKIRGLLIIDGVTFTIHEDGSDPEKAKQQIATKFIQNFDLNAIPPNYIQLLKTYTSRADKPLPTYTPAESIVEDGIRLHQQTITFTDDRGNLVQKTGKGRTIKKAMHDAARRAADALPEIYYKRKKEKH